MEKKKILSDFIKQRNANREHVATIVTEASSKLIKFFFCPSHTDFFNWSLTV